VSPTREGWIFLVTSFAVALAALNTGNNLLYLVFGGMLALLVLSGLLSEAGLRKVVVERRVVRRAHAGAPVRGTWTVRSTRRFLPTLALELEEIQGRGARLSARGLSVLPYVPAGEQRSRPAHWTFGSRGLHRLERVRVATTWPFGILRKWFDVEAPVEVLVYPELADDWESVLRPLAWTEASGAGTDAERGGTGDLRELRDHRPGEGLSAVHWRSSARLGRRVAAERDGDSGEHVEVRVELPGSGSEVERLEAFEQTISRAAAAVCSSIDRGHRVTLRVPGGQLETAWGSSGREQLLGTLALLELPA